MPSKFDPFKFSEDRELAIINYGTIVQQSIWSQFQFRDAMTEVDRLYQREKDYTEEQTKARLANRAGDATKIQDVTVPIVMPQVEAALGYFTNVFLTGYPVFGVAANPEMEDAATMLETIVGENSITGRWIPEMMMFFRDTLKYNIGALECEWATKKMSATSTDITQKNSSKTTEMLWHGNILRRMDMYNTFFDPRVPATRMHDLGEFAGYNQLMSRTALIQKMADLEIPDAGNLHAEVFSTSYPGGQISGSATTPYNYFVPLINPQPFMDTFNRYGTNWMAFVGLEGQVKGAPQVTTGANMYCWTRLYARIIPAMFNLDVEGKNLPQVWKFEIINGKKVIKAERLTNTHNYIPMFFAQPFEDGLNMQTKSFATNVGDMQYLASAMWNGYLASKRRLVGDRALFDPSRVNAKDINSINPAAKIPVRPSAYGKPIAEAVYQFPYRDEQANSFLQGSDAVVKMANLVNNQNPAQQGQFVKGNKTLHEYDDVMGHGNTGNMKMALGIEHQCFVPLKHCMLLNMLQFQSDTVLYNPELQKMVTVNTVTIRSVAVQFKVSDGLLPTDKLMSTEEYGMFFQLLSAAPQVAGEYNLGPMISYLMKLRKTDLTPFQKPPEQIQYEQQLQAWQQMASLAIQKGAEFKVPMPQPPPPAQPQPSKKGAALAATQGASVNA